MILTDSCLLPLAPRLKKRMPLPGRSEVASFLLTVSLGQYRTVIERQKCDAGRMASPVRPVIVKRVLETMNAMEAHSFYKEVLPVLSADRPQIVFDMSKTHHVDSTGISIFLQCICQAAKSDGNIKLAGALPHVAVVSELTRIGRLFEIYENSLARC